MAEDSFEINVGFLKKYFLKNNYVLGFSISCLILILAFLIFYFKIEFLELNNFVLFQLFQIFPLWISISLILMFVFSTILAYHEKYNLMFIPLFLWLLISVGYVRTQNIPGLKDITTGDWTLGPDLDPFLYLRLAQDINSGNYQKVDYMRRAPLGSENYAATSLMPWAIVFIFKISKLFGNDSLTYGAIIAPVIFFLISIITFFLFVYVLSRLKFSKNQSQLTATIASFMYAFTIQMLHRTTAGIPEIESLAMVWFWLAFAFFILAWKNEELKKNIFYGALSGIFTALMIWTWGGYNYIFLVISLTSLLVFFINKDSKKNLLIHSSWFVISFIFLFLKLKNNVFTTIPSFIFPFGVFGLLFVNYILFERKFLSIKFLEKIKLPENIKTILLSVVVSFAVLFLIKPNFIILIISNIIEQFLYPFVGTGRLGLTVSENQQIYLTNVISELGSLLNLKNLFFITSMVMIFYYSMLIIFYSSIKNLNKKQKFWLNFSFLIFTLGLLFTRYSQNSILNGENTISQVLYFGSIILFLFTFFYMYIKTYNEDKSGKNKDSFTKFKDINIYLLFLISVFFWTALSMRGAIRLLFIVSPFVIIFVSSTPVLFFEASKRLNNKIISKTLKLFAIIIVILLFGFFIKSAYVSSEISKATVPNIYNQQWQYAMSWVRENTPEKAIFTHWWDYGYWIQTIGKRPTVTDGGHAGGESAIHFIGRYVLTTPKNITAYSFMKTWNVSYLLIDSTELGKYPAYSRIGSNDSWDRISTIPIGEVNRGQILESANGTLRPYQLVGYVDQDIIYQDNGTRIFLPGQSFDSLGRPRPKSYIIGILLEESKINNSVELTTGLKQPIGIFAYNDRQYRIPLRYVYINGQIIDFKSGINSTIMIIPSIYQTQNGLKVDPLGGAIYLSEKTGSSLLARLYLMNNVFKDYNNLILVHSEDDFLVTSIKSQGIDIGDFVFYKGFRGPIKIWKVEYPENTPTYPEFQSFNYTPGGLDKKITF